MYLGIFLSALASMVVGFIWFSPFLFGKKWATESGISPESFDDTKVMPKIYVTNFILELVTAFVLWRLISLTGITTLFGILELSVLIWFGFIMPVELGKILWLRKSCLLFMINSLHKFVSIITTGTVLSLFL